MRRLATLLLVLVAACSSGDDSVGRLDLAPSTTTTTTPASAALAARLPDDAPPGFVRADDILGSGPLDLEEAASASAEPAEERDRLRGLAFERGVSRSWADTTGDKAYVAIYEFATEDGAALYDRGEQTAIAPRSESTFAVDGGAGFTTVEGTLRTHAVLLRAGERWALVLVASEDGDRTVDDARALAAKVEL